VREASILLQETVSKLDIQTCFFSFARLATTSPFATTSKSSSFHWPEGRLTAGCLGLGNPFPPDSPAMIAVPEERRCANEHPARKQGDAMLQQLPINNGSRSN
jgi:hypothetical protein